MVGDADAVWSFLHVQDAADAEVAALTTDRASTTSWRQPGPPRRLAGRHGDTAGAPTPPRRIPVWVARLAGGEGLVHMMTRARGSSNVKAKTGLGWAPLHPDWRAGFTDELMVAQ